MLCIDHQDENYFASCHSGHEAVISIWDRRCGQRTVSGSVASSAGSESGQEAALELRNVLGPAGGDIWNQRFSRTKRGCLGVLSSTGAYKTFRIAKEFMSDASKANIEQHMAPGATDSYPEPIYTKRSRDVEYPHNHSTYGRGELGRMVSFDFMNFSDNFNEPSIISLRASGDVTIVRMQPPPAPTSLSPLMDIAHGGQFADGRTFSMRSPIRDNSRKIAQVLQAIRNQAPIKNPPKDQAADASEEKGASTERLNLTSREGHEKLRAWGFSGGLSIEQALTLLTMERVRCQEGYLFNTRLNRTIVSDDPWLQGFWAMVGRTHTNATSNNLVYKGVDFSYLGIYGIWNNDLGPNPRARRVGHVPKNSDIKTLVSSLVEDLGIAKHKGCHTQFFQLRQLALYVLGVMLPAATFEAYTSTLVAQNQHSKAAFLALIQDEIKLALSALRTSSSTQAHKLLSMAIAGAPSSKSQEKPDPEWEATCASIAETLIDPYARAILAYVSGGDWHAVIAESSLPLKYRLEVALRWLPDRALSAYLNSTVREVVSAGDIEGLVLTGLTTNNALDLWQNYIRRGGDLSTAVLGMSYGCAFDDENGEYRRRWTAWQAIHRNRLNAWRLKIERCHFDVQSKKLIRVKNNLAATAAKQSVSLACNYCARSLAHATPAAAAPVNPYRGGNTSGTSTAIHTPQFGPIDGPSGGAGLAIDTNTMPVEGQVIASGITYTPQHPLTAKGKEIPGTVCPKCGRHMPRCGVCSLWLGSPDPTSKGEIGQGTISPTITGGSGGVTSPPPDRNTSIAAVVTATGGATSTVDHATGVTSSQTLDPAAAANANGAAPGTSTPPPSTPSASRSNPAFQEQMKRFVVFCVNCNHGFHAHHASEWFAKFKVCPVSECECICAR